MNAISQDNFPSTPSPPTSAGRKLSLSARRRLRLHTEKKCEIAKDKGRCARTSSLNEALDLISPTVENQHWSESLQGDTIGKENVSRQSQRAVGLPQSPHCTSSHPKRSIGSRTRGSHQWACSLCTLLNSGRKKVCSACETPRSIAQNSHAEATEERVAISLVTPLKASPANDGERMSNREPHTSEDPSPASKPAKATRAKHRKYPQQLCFTPVEEPCDGRPSSKSRETRIECSPRGKRHLNRQPATVLSTSTYGPISKANAGVPSPRHREDHQGSTISALEEIGFCPENGARMSEEIGVDLPVEQDKNAVLSRPGQDSATSGEDSHFERKKASEGAKVEPSLGLDERECSTSSTMSHQGRRKRRLIVCSDDESDDDDKAAVKDTMQTMDVDDRGTEPVDESPSSHEESVDLLQSGRREIDQGGGGNTVITVDSSMEMRGCSPRILSRKTSEVVKVDQHQEVMMELPSAADDCSHDLVGSKSSWICTACTFLNEDFSDRCAICETGKFSQTTRILDPNDDPSEEKVPHGDLESNEVRPPQLAEQADTMWSDLSINDRFDTWTHEEIGEYSDDELPPIKRFSEVFANFASVMELAYYGPCSLDYRSMFKGAGSNSAESVRSYADRLNKRRKESAARIRKKTSDSTGRSVSKAKGKKTKRRKSSSTSGKRGSAKRRKKETPARRKSGSTSSKNSETKKAFGATASTGATGFGFQKASAGLLGASFRSMRNPA